MVNRFICLPVLVLLALSGCQRPAGQRGAAGSGTSLIQAREGFKTKLAPTAGAREPAPAPPPALFGAVRYQSPAGQLAAYLSPDPRDGAKRPAIIWITGGDCNSIGDVWSPAPLANDQTASAFRQAGIVMMFPSLRGGNDNPGVKEGFLGEVDDVIAAARFLAMQPYVDGKRIYLGGHSTGGTLVLLVAEFPNPFRAIFSFGPVDDVSGYGPAYTPFDTSNPREIEVRSPGRWLASIKTPTFVFEGASGGNIESLQAMAASSKNPKVQFRPIEGGDHFNILAPTNRLIADKILRDTGPACSITFAPGEARRTPAGKGPALAKSASVSVLPRSSYRTVSRCAAGGLPSG